VNQQALLLLVLLLLCLNCAETSAIELQLYLWL
jgi:hypothetical protein